MRETTPAVALTLLLALASTVARAAPGTTTDVRVARSTTKVLASTSLDGAPQEAILDAIRNEWVAFQVVVTAAADAPLTGVDAVLSDLAGPDGARIPATEALLYREHYHRVDQPSWCDVIMNPNCADHPEYVRTPGDYPDALIPLRDPYNDPSRPVGANFEVPAGGFATLFVDLFVPAATPPGQYAGVLAVKAGATTLQDIPITLTVWDVLLPDERHVATAYGLWSGSLWSYHGGPTGGDAATRDRILRNYEWEMHRHRIDPTDLNPGLSFQFDEAGSLKPVDFTTYDAYIGPRIDGSYFPDGAGVNRYNLGMFQAGFGTGNLTEAQWGQAGKAVAEHLVEKGWMDHVYIYSHDEPWLPAYQNQHPGPIERIVTDVAAMRKYTDLWNGHILVTGPWLPELDSSVDIWCPDSAMYDDTFWPKGTWPDAGKYRDLQAQGKELWFYVCNANFPPMLGYDVDSPYGQEPRLAQWGAWQAGATGFLYWSITYWMNPNPWQVLFNLPGFGPEFARNGDGVLFYPGNHDGTDGPTAGSPPGMDVDGPAVSYRLKQVRDGMEDWELFLLAREAGGEAFTQAQVRRAVRAQGAPLNEWFDDANRPWDLDDAIVADIRQMIARKVQHLQDPGKYPDPEPPPVPDTVETVPEEAPTDAPPEAPEADVPVAEAISEAAEPPPDTSPEILPDAIAPDVPEPDVPATDALEPDAPAMDALEPDASAKDALEPDVPAPEVIRPDDGTTEALQPDAPALEVPEPDVQEPDAPATDGLGPDVPPPDASRPDAPAPDTPPADTTTADGAVDTGTASGGSSGCSATPVAAPVTAFLPAALALCALALRRRRGWTGR